MSKLHWADTETAVSYTGCIEGAEMADVKEAVMDSAQIRRLVMRFSSESDGQSEP